MELYPWQNDQWQKVMRMRDRMPHALLLQGRNGIGKRDFAMALAQSLLCDQPLTDHSACGQCHGCNWFTQGNHPDFRLLEPEETAGSGGEDGSANSKGPRKTQISVDQVRTLADFLGLSSHRSGPRIILLHPAEALNQASANALLKMLEEPPPNVLFLLVTHQPQHLLPTIRSRCSQFDMRIPARSVAEKWLAHHGIRHAAQRLSYAGGAPLRAMEQDEGSERRLTELHNMLARAGGMDPLAAAALCTREGIAHAVDILQKWTYDLLGMSLTGIIRFNTEQAASLQGLAKRVDLSKMLDFQRVLTEARRFAQHPLNAELQVESLMIQYTQIFTMPPKP
jgi:DNA polymerase III subunit delta'